VSVSNAVERIEAQAPRLPSRRYSSHVARRLPACQASGTQRRANASAATNAERRGRRYASREGPVPLLTGMSTQKRFSTSVERSEI